MEPQRIEEASLKAWPALEQILYDGWLLRFSEGYTKRANSVNLLYPSVLDVRDKVAACEQLYTAKGLPTIFRRTSFSSAANLDAVLDQRGYRRIDPTLVLHLELDGELPAPVGKAALREEGLDEWLDIFRLFASARQQHERTHRAILQAIPSRRFLASLVAHSAPMACGLGVLEDDLFGLFNLITDPAQRGRGYGTALLATMLRWAWTQGARHAYLQVMDINAPARRLYERFGFAEIYHYWYRVTGLPG